MKLKLLSEGNRIIRNISYKNYHSAKLYHNLRLFHEILWEKEVLIIYQMGKVGSSTVAKSLHNCGLDMPVYHIHSFLDENLQRAEKIYKEEFAHEPFTPRLLWDSQYLRKQLYKGLKGKKWKILTLVRDPIARNISLFFQRPNMIVSVSNNQYNIKSSTYNYEMSIKKEGSDINLYDVEKLKNIFLEKTNHNRPLTFFDDEFKGFLGIDIYSESFSKSKGYEIYKNKHIDILLIRLENLNKVSHKAFDDFLGIKSLDLEGSNIGNSKICAPIYKKFLDYMILPDSYIQKMYTSKYARYFYSKQEIETLANKWRKKSSV